jgi:hypothetical protein
MRKIAFVTCLLAAAFVGLSGCSSQPESHLEVIAAVRADSADDLAWQTEVTEYRKIMTVAFRESQHVAVTPLSDNSLDESSLDFPIPPQDPLRGLNPLQRLELAKESRKKAELELAVLAKAKLIHQQTCIIDAFYAASLRFKGDGPSVRKHLIVLGGAVEQSAIANFFDVRQNLDQETKPLIQRLQRESRLPDLRGIDACFGGVTPGQRGWISPTEFLRLKRWWASFVTASGGTLKSFGRDVPLECDD